MTGDTIDTLITDIVLETNACVASACEASEAAARLVIASHPTDADESRRRRLANVDADLLKARDRITATLGELAKLPPGLKP